MKRILAFIILALCLSVCVFADVKVEDPSYYEKFKGQNITLNVYNWGEYISDGGENTLDVIAEFEKISGIKVTYTTYETNEDLYAKLSSSNSRYDIIIPSDYMIARMINEDMLEKINFDNIPNISMIDDKYRYTDFDKTGEYSVPYTWGTVGVVYNKKHVDQEDIGSWDLLWNQKYSGAILMFSNSRDAFGVALKKLGYSLNSTNEHEIAQATEFIDTKKRNFRDYADDGSLYKSYKITHNRNNQALNNHFCTQVYSPCYASLKSYSLNVNTD